MTAHRPGLLGLLAGLALTLPLLGLAAAPAGAGEPPDTCAGEPATIVGTNGHDVIVGTEGPDVISAGGGSDRIDALGGDDLVCGGGGNDEILGGDGDDFLYGEDEDDTLSGGAGDDVLHGGSEGDELAGGPGNDVLRGGSDAFGASDLASFDGATAGVTVDLAERTSSGETEGTDTLIGIEGARGSAHADMLLGSRLPDLLIGNGGDDELLGRGGDNTLVADSGVARGHQGDDVAEVTGTAEVFMGPGEDRVEAGPGVGTARLGPGDDHSETHAGSFTIIGGRGQDTFRLWWEDFLDEGPALEDPILVGGKGHDRLLWDTPWPVILSVGEGELTSDYGTARFTGISHFRGGEGDDRMYGTDGPQTLVGGFGDDLVKGYGGPDVLRGGPGDDQAFGGPGRDRCTAEYEHGCER